MAEQGNRSSVVLRASVSQDFGPPVGRVLDRFVIECHAGEVTVLLGTSGCGKTTLLQLLAEACGERSQASLSNVETDVAPTHYAFAFQHPELVSWRNVEGNARYELDLCSTSVAAKDGNVADLLALAGLREAGSLFPHQLSTGMRQRVQLIRAVARPAPLILLDEPLAAVDQPQRLAIARALRARFRQAGTAALWVTHDLLEALAVADRILVVGGRPLRMLSEQTVTLADRPRPDLTSDKHGSAAVMSGLLAALGSASILPESATGITANAASPTATSEQLGRSRWVSWVILAAVLLLLAIVWESIVLLAPNLAFFVPPPHDWGPRLLHRIATTDFAGQVWVTVRECLLGLSFGFLVGTLFGYLAGLVELFSRAVRPLFVGLTAVPLFVLAPAFIVWFGIGEQMKVALAACSAFPFVALAVLDAVTNSRGAFHTYLRRNGARAWPLFLHHTLPYTMASWFIGLRAAGIAALLGAFLGEFISAERGLGYLILLDAGRYRIADAIGGVAVLFAVAILLDAVFRLLASLRHWFLFKLKL